MQVVTPETVDHAVTEELTLEDGSQSRVTHYFGSRGVESETVPDAFLVEYRPAPGCDIRPHFHRVPQFQVVVGGDGRLGKRPVPPVSFHFADAYTPYGPIVPADEERGIDFFTLRPKSRPGLWWMPGSKSEMKGRAGRNIAVPVPEQPPLESGSQCETLIERHEDGLAAFRLRLAPGEETTGPATDGSDGQFYLVVGGSLRGEEVEAPRNSLLYVEPDDPAATVTAGDEGADVLVLQYPVDMAALAG
ncbi:MAG: hypothetical protein QOG06_1475 [Gaiellaceae bacterium]|jgi:hypothetical protein|nr:hypothetical protein [Gaiellaceae bacterium]